MDSLEVRMVGRMVVCWVRGLDGFVVSRFGGLNA